MNRLTRIAALMLALMLLMAGSALAAGNVNIAVRGQNGFDDGVSSMSIWDGRLLLATWNSMYVWEPGGELTEVQGAKEMEQQLYEVATTEDGTQVYTIGDHEIEVEEGMGLSMYGDMIVAGDRLLRRAEIYGEDGLESTLFVEIRIDEDGTPTFGDIFDMEDAMMVEYGDGYTSSRDVQNPCMADGLIYALSYGDMGRGLIAIDLENADVEVLSLDVEGDIYSMSPFTEGKLLLVELNYNTDPMETNLLSYDIEREEVKKLGALPSENWNAPTAIVFDEARSMMYYVLSGSVWRMAVTEEGLGEPEEFGDMPLEIYNDAGAVLLDDLYILSSYEGVVGRDVTVEKLPEQRLRVQNLSYLETVRSAYFPFTEAHPEFMVALSNSGMTDAILQDMMNRSADVDIYTLSASDSAYAALMERGFLAELGGSEALRAGVEAMYPSLQDVAMKDGEIYAVPMSLYTNAPALNTALLTGKLGYSEADIPTNWTDLFHLLADIAREKKMEAYPEVSLFSPGYSVQDAKYHLFSEMMGSYFLWLDQSEENLVRGSDVLLANCAAFEAIDFAALGLPEEVDYEDESIWEYEPENILMETSAGIHPRHYYEEQMVPMILAIAPGEPQLMMIEASLAFVNPFSTQREAAIEYLEHAFSLLDESDLIVMMPDKNDPVLSPYYEENLASYDRTIADIEAQLAKEDLDEEMRDMFTEQLEDFKIYREEYVEEGRWEISAQNIERYRKYAQYGVVARANVWSSGVGSQMSQYMDGAITAQQLAAELEKTLQMQRLEGM